MRVKRQKPDDLIDALKHLKIADRRSRLSFRGGRPTGSLAFLGSSSLEQTLRCRLTRSASSNSAGIHHYGAFSNYPCDCCCAMGHHQTRADPIDVVECPMCSRLSCRGSTQLAGGLSPIPAVNSAAVSAGSGFTTSAGLLYSTLPTNLEFRHGRHPDLSHSQHVLQSDKLRRSCGAGLSHLDFDPVMCGQGTTSTTQSRSSFGSATTSNSDRHHCCVHSGLVHLPPLTHLRLYRRLYSLIDHPCVSWYNASRLLRCSHRSSVQCSISAAGKCTLHRHSLSLRHRHTTPGSVSSQYNPRAEAPPTLPDLPSASLVLRDPMLQSDLTPVNCDRSIPDFPSNSNPATFDVSQIPRCPNTSSIYRFGCNSAAPDRHCLPTGPDNRRSFPQSDVLGVQALTNSSFLSSQPTSFETGDLCGSECASSSSIITRCRRNSDPEQWQLVKTMRICTTDDPPRVNQITNRGDTQPLSYSRPACDLQTGQLGVGSNAHRSFLTRSLQTDDQRSHWNFCSTQRNVSRVSTEDPSTYYRDPLLANPHSTVFRDGIEYTGVRTNPVSSLHPPRLQAQQHQEQGSLSEPSHKMDCSLRSFSFRPSVLSSQFPEASQPPSSAVSSTTLVPGPFHLSTKPCGDSIGSTSSNPGSKQVNICPEDSSLSWSGMKEPSASTVDRQTQSVVAILQSDDGTSMQSLQQNLPLLEGSSDTTNGGAGRSQLTSDISVNELAAYMEHMVHIPGRMSEMAQRMYL